MPKTRNVSRSQWDAADAKRKTRKAKENDHEGEKENKGRVTRTSTRAGSRRGGLGAPATQTTTTAAKGKGKEKPPGKGSLTKEEKLPLQDITARFLPAPESANRGYPQLGEGFDADQAGAIVSPLHLSVLRTVARRTVRRNSTAGAYPSSLPPSSPPPQQAASLAPQQDQDSSELPILPPSSPLPDVRRRLFPASEPATEEEPKAYDAWDEFDRVVRDNERPTRPVPTPRNSDPFGFFALEKKLEAERVHQVEIEDEDEEAGGEILVADTSSPRPVRRLPKHKYVIEAEVAHHHAHSEDDFSHLPPTPQKTVDRTRYSHRGGDVDEEHLYSPGPSSCPSSPSPSKPRLPLASPTKRKARQFDDEVEEQEPESSPGRKQPRLEEDVEETGNRRQLRSRSVKADEPEASTSVVEEKEKRKARTTKAAKKGVKKGKSKATSSNVVEEDPDMDEWEREREVRLEYFRQLEEYDYETENVYVV